MTQARLLATSVALVALGCSGSQLAGPPTDLPAHQGQIVVECAWSHAAPDDPIVLPDQPGASHLHEFFGNTAIDAFSTTEAFVAGDTTCETKADRAAYWVPALLDAEGRRVAPTRLDAYYRVGRGVDPADVVPYPFGLEMIAGDANARGRQPTSIVGWSCSANPARSAEPPTCTGQLRLRVTFPDCWDAETLESDGPGGNVAYSGRDGCPASHPLAVPQLEVVIHYPFSGDPTGLSLSAGPIHTAHSDFWNLWDPEALAREVTQCLVADVVCGTASA